MSLSLIAFIAPNYRDFKGDFVKFYEPATTTPKLIYLDSAGLTSVAKLQFDSDGFMSSAGGAIIVPYIDGSYDAYIFISESDADANNTVNAIRIADDLTPTAGGGTGGATSAIANVIKETRTLLSGQNVVTFSNAPAINANIFINGTGADNGRIHEVGDYVLREDISPQSIQLNNSYAEGTKITIYSYGLISSNNSAQNGNKIEIIAHRGFVDSFPQNTMLAFTSAIRRGADSLECDVQITSDGIPVVFHDTTVDALTNGSGAVSTLTLATVQALLIDEVAGTAYSNTRIPTFAELLRYCKGAGLRLYPEIKQYRTQADISLMIANVISAKMEYQTFFSSFLLSDVTAFKVINNEILCGLLGSSAVQASYEASIDAVAALGNSSIVWQDAAIITSPAIVTYARDRGVDVQAWTIVSNTRAKDLMRLGVYKIITDRKLEVL
jgi:glycerophosphoryl diester phosphodiesterase